MAASGGQVLVDETRAALGEVAQATSVHRRAQEVQRRQGNQWRRFVFFTDLRAGVFREDGLRAPDRLVLDDDGRPLAMRTRRAADSP